MNYQEDVYIDGQALDKEWLGQASLMMKYCQIAAQTEEVMDAKKELLDVIKAGLEKNIRTHPDQFGLAKITDVVVANTVILQEDYTEAFGTYLKTKYEFQMAKGAVRAIEQRCKALENLVNLFGKQYFAGPKMPLALDREWEKAEAQRVSDSHVIKMVRKNKE